jgi:hypothetical protein
LDFANNEQIKDLVVLIDFGNFRGQIRTFKTNVDDEIGFAEDEKYMGSNAK